MKYQRTYTTSTKKLTPQKYAQIKASALKSATSNEMKRFINSSGFRKQVLNNIKTARSQRSKQLIEKTVNRITTNAEQRRILTRIIGERKPNQFHSLANLKRLENLNRRTMKNTDAIKRTLQSTQRYKQLTPEQRRNFTTVKDLTTVQDRTDFYINNDKDINEYNKLQTKHGQLKARETKVGQKLQTQWTIDTNKLIEDDLLGAFDK